MPRQEYAVLIVGAGIAGIRSALDLAESGHRVLLLDKRPHIGGILAQIDYQFPTDQCGMCKMLPMTERDESSQFCLRKGLFHRNLDIMLASSLISMEGEPGKFQATIKQQSSLVDPHKCISCGQCSAVCPVRVPWEFNANLGERAAIYLPVPHNIPNQYVVDLENCQRCWECVEVCPTSAVDFKFAERQNFHILIVHADQASRDSIAKALDQENFPLHWAHTGQEALQKVEENREWGLVLLAADLPDVETQRILQRGLECQPGLQVAILYQAGQERLVRELLDLGARTSLCMSWRDDFTAWLDKLYLRIMYEEIYRVQVGALILACGFECHDPVQAEEVPGYQDLPQVLTAIEFERLLSSAGPTAGELQRTDGSPVRSIAWLQCVGSRDLRQGADYCSSICCMYSIKQAQLAKERSRGEIETSIFAIDVRSFGKGHQRYKDQAEQEYGLRFVLARPHSVLPDGQGGVLLRYVDQTGQVQIECYDWLVLAVGVRPTRDMPQLVQALGLETNEFGFCRTEPLAPSKSSQFGVFVAGAFAEPKDITDTIIQSSAAALEASRLVALYTAPKAEEAESEPVYRDVEQEAPSTLIVLCDACPTLEQSVDMHILTSKLQGMSTVHSVMHVAQACTESGWQVIEEKVCQGRPNRIVLGACLPYAHVPRLRELGRTVGLNPAFMEVVDIFTPTFPNMPLSSEQCLQEVVTSLGAAVVKVQHAEPLPLLQSFTVTPLALVVGGGLAGLTAALAIADHNLEVCLVEEKEELGGTASRLGFTLEYADPARVMQDLILEVQKHPKIKVLTESRVVSSIGEGCQFMSAVQTAEGESLHVTHSATILATGGGEAKSYAYGYATSKRIFQQLQFEEQLSTGALDCSALFGVIMIQCVECRQESRNYCSRICCCTSLKHALILKKRNPQLPVYILYRDMMSYGFSEHYFREARELGVVFIRYSLQHPPQMQKTEQGFSVDIWEPILQRTLQIEADILVLASGVQPNDTEELREIFQVTADEDGFLTEAEPKWRPVELLSQGIFICGLARAPGNMRETIASAKAAAQKALRILSHENISGGTIAAEVRHSLCSLCQICISACPYGARSLDWEQGLIRVNEIICQGCGVCTVSCPNGAAILRGLSQSQVLAEIDAALGIVP